MCSKTPSRISSCFQRERNFNSPPHTGDKSHREVPTFHSVTSFAPFHKRKSDQSDWSDLRRAEFLSGIVPECTRCATVPNCVLVSKGLFSNPAGAL